MLLKPPAEKRPAAPPAPGCWEPSWLSLPPTAGTSAPEPQHRGLFCGPFPGPPSARFSQGLFCYLVLRTPGDRYSVFVSFLMCITADCFLWQAAENSARIGEGERECVVLQTACTWGRLRPQLCVGPWKIIMVSPSPSVSFSVLFRLRSQAVPAGGTVAASHSQKSSCHRSPSKSLIGLIGLRLGHTPGLWVGWESGERLPPRG